MRFSRRVALALIVAGFVVGNLIADPVEFTLNGDNTTVAFVGTKTKPFPGKHDGGFKKVDGKLRVDGDDIKLSVVIDADSVWTDEPKLTNHLKTKDFFDVKTNPTAKFVSTKVEKTAAGINITGDLTLNGKTKSISFPATLTTTGDSATLISKFTINRMDFGVAYGKGQINDDVALTVNVKAKK